MDVVTVLLRRWSMSEGGDRPQWVHNAFRLKNVRPFVEPTAYDPSKVKRLRESIRATGYWDNMIGREVEGGKAEIADGRHRLRALLEEFGPDHEVEIIVAPLTYGQMLQMKAEANRAEWSTDAERHLLTVCALVKAYAAGTITPPKPKGADKAKIRYAPSFVRGQPPAPGVVLRPYTTASLAQFLGWSDLGRFHLDVSLNALELIEQGLITESDFRGLTSHEARAVVRQMQRALTRAANQPQDSPGAGFRLS
jgi:hypothetical protein